MGLRALGREGEQKADMILLQPSYLDASIESSPSSSRQVPCKWQDRQAPLP